MSVLKRLLQPLLGETTLGLRLADRSVRHVFHIILGHLRVPQVLHRKSSSAGGEPSERSVVPEKRRQRGLSPDHSSRPGDMVNPENRGMTFRPKILQYIADVPAARRVEGKEGR